ncbi:MAG: lytic transglycosylase domain-containing protein [Solirubrobacteraceae bacterium]|nr:lytic transglycosylase domain-containing protein [Solirubrobacteraceae bacterium]
MSVAAIDARVGEIQQMLAQLRAVQDPTAAAPVATTTSTTTATTPFAAALAGARGQIAAGASTATASPYASTTGVLAGSAAGAAFVPPAEAGAYGPMIVEAAQRHGIDPRVFTELVRQESGFDPNVTSSAGARGLTQLMPGTAAGLGVTDPTDPAQALDGGARYLRQQLDRYDGDYVKALAAYNAGPGAVDRFGGVPPYAETQHYVRTITTKAGIA